MTRMNQMTGITEFQKQSVRGSLCLPCWYLVELRSFYKYEHITETCIVFI